METTNWQQEQKECECLIHRYHCAHLCECGQLFAHSQSQCDEHRQHDYITFDSELYKHGNTAKDMFDRLSIMGLLPYGTEAYEKVYNYAAEHWN